MTRAQHAEIKSLAILILSIIAVYIAYLASQIGIILQIIAAFVILLLCGIGIQRTMEFKGGYGLMLLGGSHGITTINKLAKNKSEFWEQFAMWGLTLGLGLATYPLLKGKIKKSTYLIGLISLVVAEVFVVPYVAYGLQFVKLPGISVSATQFSLPNLSVFLQPFELAELIITVIFGFAGSAMFAIIYNSGSILYSVAGFLSNPTPAGAAASGIASQIPGVAPVIPGITMPLIAGIVSLAILLIVHEFSHGVLARRAKIRIKQIGILLFGFIPIGGFVEPDEKSLQKSKKEVQTNVFSAGIAANFLFMFIFFVLTLLFVIVIIPHAYSYGVVVLSTTPGYPAHGVIPNGTVITAWNGHQVSNITSLESAAASDVPNGIVTVTNNLNHTYSVMAVASPANASKGLIGVSLGYKPILDTPLAQLAYFLFTVVSLSMLLNFLVAVVNLLPIPGFDGWRIYKVNIKNERLVNTLGALIIILLVVNIIPWAFYI